MKIYVPAKEAPALAEEIKLLVDLFNKASEGERESQKMYMDAIELCEDAKTVRSATCNV